MISSIKGMKDILPAETESWQFIENTIHNICQQFHFKEIRTPLLEQTSLFKRSIGEETDIVSKEMYTFFDRSNDSITLKPEATASIVRSFIQNHIGEDQPSTKLYQISAMFRQERPQAGRLRQFHQYDAEIFGSTEPSADAEIILLNSAIFKNLGLTNFKLILNSVGCENCRPNYRDAILKNLTSLKNKLTPQSRERLEKNPLRVLDSKEAEDIEATKNLPLIFEFLCDSCKTHFDELQNILKSVNLNFTINNRLVRGLDYYTKTAFEFISENLGSQDALSGGGRYDLLVSQLGGKKTPAVGFAGGIERLLMAIKKENQNLINNKTLKLFIASADTSSKNIVFQNANNLRNAGISTDFDLLNRSLKSQMREADRQNAEYLIVIGEKEISEEKVLIKNMQTRTSSLINLPINIEEINLIINK
ncbi:MAG: histidine--tRNA ligase [Bacteroidetes bacterium]|nr:histidine--tRNA ligase [Bacteroidota bacterium]